MRLVLTGETRYPEPVIDSLELLLKDGRKVVVDWDESFPPSCDMPFVPWYDRFEAHMEQVYFRISGEEDPLPIKIRDLQGAKIQSVSWYSCALEEEHTEDIFVDSMCFTDGAETVSAEGLLLPYQVAPDWYRMVAGKEETCPVCGKILTYLDSSPDYLWWECESCGTTGKEGKNYKDGTAIFDGYHYDVKPYEKDRTAHEREEISFSRILAALPMETDGNFMTDGSQILCRTEPHCEKAADFLKAMGFDVVTGYYDPEEDKKESFVDHYTGWYYIDIN